MEMDETQKQELRNQITEWNSQITTLNTQINGINAQINTLNERKILVQKLMDNINNIIIPNLTSAINEINNTKTNLQSYFSDSETSDKLATTLHHNSDDVSNIKKDLVKVIIPSLKTQISNIDTNISNLKNQINNLNSQIGQLNGHIRETSIMIS